MTWVLDACVLVRAQEADAIGDLLGVAARAPVVLVEDVYAELTDPQSTKAEVRRRAAEAKRAIDASRCAVVPIPLEGPVAEVVAYLRGQRTTANDAGECASIALVSLTPDHWFVTSDRAATFVATREVDGRTVSLPWFLRKCVEGGILEKPVAAAIAATERTRPPAWWADWVAS